uniref:Uncharacterized protein n=1 Tax=Ciona intestinalis TaxID=7719 RepID=H2XNX3_CIOIN
MYSNEAIIFLPGFESRPPSPPMLTEEQTTRQET